MVAAPPLPDERIPIAPNVLLPPGFQSLPASDTDGSLSGFRRVGCPLRLRIDDALPSYREDDTDWHDACRTRQSCSLSRRATLTSHLYNDCELAPSFWIVPPASLPALPWRPTSLTGARPTSSRSSLGTWPREGIGRERTGKSPQRHGAVSACKKEQAVSTTAPWL